MCFVLSISTSKIQALFKQNCFNPSIFSTHRERTLYNLLQKIRLKGTIKDLPWQKKARILKKEMMAYIKEKLRENDELTATGIKTELLRKWPDLKVSIPTIKHVRKEMGWVCTRPHYYQLLCEVHTCYSCAMHKINVLSPFMWECTTNSLTGAL